MSGSTGGRIAIALLLVAFAVGAFLTYEVTSDGLTPGLFRGDRVGVLPVEGVISAERDLLADLRWLEKRSSVKAIVLKVNSPGGTVGGTQSLYRELQRVRRELDRPIVAWIGEVGASGGYYASMAADSVLALPGAITGSIGVIMQFPNAGELMRKVGVELEVVKSGELKDMGSLTRPLSEQERAVLRRLVNDAYGQFLEAVRGGRSLPPDSLRNLADGRIFSGQRAAELGLVDRTGTLREAVSAAGRMVGLGTSPDTVYPPEERISFVDFLTGVRTGRLDGLTRWLPDWMREPGSSRPELLYLWR
ncbi:MAG: signal peptide peptidase SppA [Candidatus Palauibacterales bacterium]|nr:signal peptide peptidase SppA [Candidatus Palauibacterales bacterium]